MSEFATRNLAQAPRVTAPDGSEVRILLGTPRGGMAQFVLQAGEVARAVVHRSVDELWYIVSGRGQMWRRNELESSIVGLEPGVCLSLPCGTSFQFRAAETEPLAAVAVTMPPWPGEDEAIVVEGPWPPSLLRASTPKE